MDNSSSIVMYNATVKSGLQEMQINNSNIVLGSDAPGNRNQMFFDSKGFDPN